MFSYLTPHPDTPRHPTTTTRPRPPGLGGIPSTHYLGDIHATELPNIRSVPVARS